MPEAGTCAAQITRRYVERTPASAAAFARAAASLPGGDTRTMTSYAPHPLYFDLGEDARVRDLDGHWYEDMLANYGALAHGHSHPALLHAVQDQVARGTAPGGPSTLQFRHAELLRSKVPSMRRLRYCNSGTEATMWALRTARAFTGRDIIVKIDGGYHGTHDWGHVSAFITGGPAQRQAVPGLPRAYLAHGVPRGVLDSVVTVPFNDADAVGRVLEQLGDQVAAVIVEPVLGVGGAVPADSGYLHRVRESTTAHDVLLILDECATFRLGPWQVKHGLVPDLTTFSKIIGGGLPMGVFGGREDVMALFDPAGPDPVYHASAFGGNNLSLAAGIAALEHFNAGSVAFLDELGTRTREGLSKEAAEAGVAACTSGEGGLSYLHFGSAPPRDAAETATLRRGREELRGLVHLSLLNEGFLTARHGLLCQSLLTTTDTVDAFTAAYGRTLRRLRPYLQERHPELVVAPDGPGPVGPRSGT